MQQKRNSNLRELEKLITTQASANNIKLTRQLIEKEIHPKAIKIETIPKMHKARKALPQAIQIVIVNSNLCFY